MHRPARPVEALYQAIEAGLTSASDAPWDVAEQAFYDLATTRGLDSAQRRTEITMPDWSVCYSWMLANEDPQHLYATTTDSNGAGVISGINAAVFPTPFAAINAMPQAERGPAVELFYQTAFWSQWFERLASDDVAKRVFDASVNMGPRTAVRLLQRAFNAIAAQSTVIGVDGQWGPQTLAAVNSAPAMGIVAAFQQVREAYYRAIVAANPADEPYLTGWIARASQ